MTEAEAVSNVRHFVDVAKRVGWLGHVECEGATEHSMITRDDLETLLSHLDSLRDYVPIVPRGKVWFRLSIFRDSGQVHVTNQMTEREFHAATCSEMASRILTPMAFQAVASVKRANG